MDADLALVAGLILLGISVPGILSSISEGRSSRVSTLVIFVGIGLIVFAMYSQPGGYSVAEIPDVFFGVLGRYLN